MVNTQQTLGELVAAIPAAARVFHRYGLDFCCGGKQSLAQACAAEQLDPEAVIQEIETTAASEQEQVRWDQRPLEELIQHILDRYHAPLKTEIPRLVDLARQVEDSHRDRPDRPAGLADLLEEVRTAVESHLAKEEQVLFPLILSGRGQMAHMPVQVMIKEHEDHGQNLRRIRALTNDLRIPDDACASWRELYRSLAQLEVDLMDHISLENNVLFPRALGGDL
jgi:regulator of cell morphogenesis and NO signaling